MTRRIDPHRLLAILLGGVVMLLAGTVAWQIASSGSEDQTELLQPAAAAGLPEVPDLLSLPELAFEDYAAIAERPVFAASRRPPSGPTEAVAPRAPAARQADLELVGLVADGDRRMALLRQHGQRETVQVAAGETYRGWTIAEIGTDFVRVQSADGELELRLAYKPQ